MALRQCSRDSSHQYPDHLPQCPYCSQASITTKAAAARSAAAPPPVHTIPSGASTLGGSQPPTASPPATVQGSYLASHRPVWQSILLTPVGALAGAVVGLLASLVVVVIGAILGMFIPALNNGTLATIVVAVLLFIGAVAGIIFVWVRSP